MNLHINKVAIILSLYVGFSFFITPCYAAKWLCTEAAALAEGDTFYSCGIGVSEFEQESRDIARRSAINEFEEICKRSKNCNGYEYIITPLRTDCYRANQKFKCYRGLQYTIGKSRKKESVIDLEDLNNKISEKEVELKRLRATVYAKQKLNYIEKKIKESKLKASQARHNNDVTSEELELKEIELIQLKSDVIKYRNSDEVVKEHERKGEGFFINFGLINDMPFKNSGSNSGAYNLSISTIDYISEYSSHFYNFSISGISGHKQEGYESSFIEGSFDTGIRFDLFDFIVVTPFIGYGVWEFSSDLPSSAYKQISAHGLRYGIGLGYFNSTTKKNKKEISYRRYSFEIIADRYNNLSIQQDDLTAEPQWRGKFIFSVGSEF